MPKQKKKKEDNLGITEEELGISNISKNFGEFKEEHWRLTQQILCLKAKTKEKEKDRAVLEKDMRESALADKSLWSQIEFAF